MGRDGFGEGHLDILTTLYPNGTNDTSPTYDVTNKGAVDDLDVQVTATALGCLRWYDINWLGDSILGKIRNRKDGKNMKKLIVIAGIVSSLCVNGILFSGEESNKQLQTGTMAQEYKKACEEGKEKLAFLMANQLSKLGKDSIPVFEEMIKTNNSLAIQSSAISLGEIGGNDAVSILKERYVTLPNKYLKKDFLEALGEIGTKDNADAQNALRNIMNTETDEEVKIHAAAELHKSNPDPIAEKLILDNTMRYYDVIISIEKSIGTWNHRKGDINDRAIELLLDENVSKSGWFKSIYAAGEILRKTNYPETLEILSKSYRIQTNYISKVQVLNVLGKIKSKDSTKLLLGILNDKKTDESLREKVNEILKSK